MSDNGSSTNTGCTDPSPTTTTWVLLGVFLALAFFSRILVILLFRGISGACKSYGATHFDRSFRKLFENPVAVLLVLLFLYLAWEVAPWLCALHWLRNVIEFLLLVAALVTVLILISRVFDFAEIFLRFFSLNRVHSTALREGFRVAKLAALFFIGLLFFSIIVVELDPATDFRVDIFFSGVNIISLSYIVFFIPVTRDVLGGIQIISDSPFGLGDWIEIDGIRGTVDRIGLFVVVIRTLQGRMTMVSNSRFVESFFVVHPVARRRVIVLRFPIPPRLRICAGSDAAIRNLLVNIEASIKGDVAVTQAQESLVLSNDVFVNMVSNSCGEQVEVRYVSDDINSIEDQAARMKDLIAIITQRQGLSMAQS